MDKKLLVAVDSSIYSNNILSYLEKLFTGLPDIRLHLFSVVTCNTSEAAREWFDEFELLNMLSREAQGRYATKKKYLKTAVERLERNGIPAEQVTTELKVTAYNQAKEILNTARKGLYDALIIGRRGLSKLEKLFMGSVSTSLLEKCHDVPIWIIDGQVDSRKFLVPVDGSQFTLQALDHLCFVLLNNPYAEITLFHSTAMFSQTQELKRDYCPRFLDKDWCEAHLDDKEFYFQAPYQMLINSGFPAERIHRLETSKGLHSSRQIVQQALVDNFGTIVMGRRSREIKKGVFGSVTEKVLEMSVDTAVWIVG